MLGIHDLPLFAVAAFILCATPGPDIFYVLGRSVAQGRRAGVLSALGISSGAAVHVVCAAFGLSAFLATSAHAFTLVRWAGAAYLVYLGARTIMSKDNFAMPEGDGAAKSAWALYRQGFLTDLLNPKVALFFLAFLPQFIDPASTHRVWAFLVLGLIVLVIGLMCDMTVALLSYHISSKLRRNSLFMAHANKIMGSLFVGLGLNLACEDR